MNSSLLLIYVFSVVALIVTPGPVVALIITTSLQSGSRRALLTAAGTNLASLILALVAVLILSGSFSVSPGLLSAISSVGCLFILYLAVQGLRYPPGPGVQTRCARSGVGRGFLVGISNPKDIIFFVAFFPQFIHVADSFSASVAWLTGLWVLIDFAVLAGYIALARQAFALKYRAVINRVACLVLLAVALMGIVHSGRLLLG
ncbi:LysE family translocator [Pseudomonas sp. ADAK22]|uniref:LysE family translocator n=1 Tax=Pseudomonas sp. ADAK22 TaxID=2730851 RepID=UPI001464044C|nr:LysE family translocator [Pseudomonas sp. ADAK22]QJI11828.1 LysE family translocator [Pseudomonas sp. ADAK22]